jgi:hypothetical protein
MRGAEMRRLSTLAVDFPTPYYTFQLLGILS